MELDEGSCKPEAERAGRAQEEGANEGDRQIGGDRHEQICFSPPILLLAVHIEVLIPVQSCAGAT